MTKALSEAGAPRSAIWRRLIEKWRRHASTLLSQAADHPQGSCDHAWRMEACRVFTKSADELDASLRACADALAPSPEKGELMELPDIELVAAKVHEAWMETKRAQGITSRPAADGTEQMVPYADLPDALQELDRSTVRAVYAAIEASAK
jgi:hypothetical protein